MALIHLAIALNGTVIAHFMNSEDAAAFCAEKGRTHVPYNPNNRDGAPTPAVGFALQGLSVQSTIQVEEST